MFRFRLSRGGSVSGGYVPYRLRQNKAVERLAFLELLRKLNRHEACHIPDYSYTGFGGPSLEDFKLLHNSFGIKKLISLESNRYVHKRQEFNKPVSCIECRNEKSGDFLTTFQRRESSIVWFDFTSAKDLRVQVEEFQNLLSKLAEYDIAKITLNANPSNWVNSTEARGKELFKLRFAKLEDTLDDLLTSAVDVDMMSNNGFPNALVKIVQYATSKAMRPRSDMTFQPLTAFAYADGQQMLTVTGIILSKSESNSFLKKTGVARWQLANTDWSTPKEINVPDFSAKERIYVDAKLPKYSADTIHKWLGLQFSKKRSESLEMMRIYTEFYRHSPYFSEVII